MIIDVSVKTSCKKSQLIIKDGVYHIHLKSKAIKNNANFELIDILSSYFNTSKSSVKILRGLKGRKKSVEILEE